MDGLPPTCISFSLEGVSTKFNLIAFQRKGECIERIAQDVLIKHSRLILFYRTNHFLMVLPFKIKQDTETRCVDRTNEQHLLYNLNKPRNSMTELLRRGFAGKDN